MLSKVLGRDEIHLFFQHMQGTHMLQDLMGHADVKTTARCTHVMDKDISQLTSPLDVL